MIEGKEMSLAREYIERLSSDSGDKYSLTGIGEALQVDMEALLSEVIEHTAITSIVGDILPTPTLDEVPSLKALLASEQMMGYMRGIVAARLEGQ